MTAIIIFIQCCSRCPRKCNKENKQIHLKSRNKITLTANYKLIDKNTKETVLSSSTTALGAFNVFYEPYTTYQAEKRQTEDLVQIVANNISLRVAAYLKQKEVESESETSSN